MTESELRARDPDIVLLDITTLETTRVAQAIVPFSATKVVALGVAEIEREVLALVEAGVAGYVSREGSLSDLTTVIERVVSDEMPVSPKIAAGLIRRIATLAAERPHAPGIQELTARETEILHLVNEGLSNKEIASALHIELSTVKNHVHRILEKLGARRRTEAAAKFRRLHDRWT